MNSTVIALIAFAGIFGAALLAMRLRAALPDLAQEMQESSQRANRYERMVLDLVEAGLLQHRVGESFAAVVVDVNAKDHSRGTVTVACGRATPTTIAASPMSSTRSGRWRSRPGPRRTTFGSSAGLAKRAPKRPRRRSKRT